LLHVQRKELPVMVLLPSGDSSCLAHAAAADFTPPLLHQYIQTTYNALDAAFATAAEELPAMVLPPLEYPSILAPAADSININSQIMQIYLNSLLPGEAQRAAAVNRPVLQYQGSAVGSHAWYSALLPAWLTVCIQQSMLLLILSSILRALCDIG
jgi:hypothetical protein